MRYYQLLLEFDVAKTAQAMGMKILVHLEFEEQNYSQFAHKVTMAAMNEFSAVKGYGFHWKKFKNYTDKLKIKFAIEEIIAYDPTPNKKYSQWMCSRFGAGAYAGEDLGRVQNALITFDNMKRANFFRNNAEYSQYADINRFKTLRDLEQFIDIAEGEKVKSQSQLDKPDAHEYKIVAEDGRYRIIIPFTQKAENYFGVNTKWCTTSENGEAFGQYIAKGPLFIILDKPNNRRWQFHFETGQFMDETDEPIDWAAFDPHILEMYEWPFNKLAGDINKIKLLTTMPDKIARNIRITNGVAIALINLFDQDTLDSRLVKRLSEHKMDTPSIGRVTTFGDVTIRQYNDIATMLVDHNAINKVDTSNITDLTSDQTIRNFIRVVTYSPELYLSITIGNNLFFFLSDINGFNLSKEIQFNRHGHVISNRHMLWDLKNLGNKYLEILPPSDNWEEVFRFLYAKATRKL